MPPTADPPSPRAASAGGGERGTTLIEVMAATAVLGVLVLCLANLWAVCDRMSFALLLRQKAVFVVNGEMERLAVLYNTTAFGAGTLTTTTGYPALVNIPNSKTRLIYATNSTAISAVTVSAASLQAADSAVWLYGSGSSARNYVWLDASRSVLARLSWLQCAITAATLQTCLNVNGTAGTAPNGATYTCYAFAGGTAGGNCALVLLVLEYPFRLSGGVPVAMSDPATLTLSTIVGRRR